MQHTGPSPAGSWDVLVVDDEPVVRDAVRRILEAEGMRVAAAADGRAALAHPAISTCRLVLCDLMLPDRHGTEVIQDLLARRPDLAVVVITGYATSTSTARACGAGVSELLLKPFDESELLWVVRRALEGRVAGREEIRP